MRIQGAWPPGRVRNNRKFCRYIKGGLENRGPASITTIQCVAGGIVKSEPNRHDDDMKLTFPLRTGDVRMDKETSSALADLVLILIFVAGFAIGRFGGQCVP